MTEPNDKPEKTTNDVVKVLGPAIIGAAGNVIGGIFAGKGSTDDKVDAKIKKLKNSKTFHWILFVGIGVIALGAFIEGVITIVELVQSIYEWGRGLIYK